MAEKVDGGTRGGSPADSSPSTIGSSQGKHLLSLNLAQNFFTHMTLDPIILSDDESVGAESKTEYSDLDVDLAAKSDLNPLHVAASELADGSGFALRTALAPDRLVADYQDGDDTHNNSVVDNTQLWLSISPLRAASPRHGFVTHQPSKLQVNTDIPQRSTSFVDLDSNTELEGEGSSVPAEGHEHDNNTRSTKRRRLSAVSDTNPPFNGNVSGLQDNQSDYPQSPQPGLAAASLHPSDLENDHLPKQRRQRGATRNVHRKHPRTTASTRLASTGGTPSAALEFSDLDEAQPGTQITTPGQEMVDDGNTNDSDNEDYDNESAAAGSKRGRRPRSQKRIR